MDTYVVTILPDGRITIPSAIRKELGLHPGDALVYWRKGREVYLRKAKPGEIVPSAENAEDPSVDDTSGRDTG